MQLFWFLLGVLSTIAALFVLLPWLRTIPRLGPLPAVRWPWTVGAALLLAAAVGLYFLVGRPDLADRSSPTTPSASLGSAAMARGSAMGDASSMATAIASLRGRLAQGGGSTDDWELLAKSYEFIGRPSDAALARARQLPPPPDAATATAGPAAAPAAASASAPVLTPSSAKRLNEAASDRRAKKLSAAAAIYAQLAASGQMTADSWADYADTAATLHGRRLAGEPETYIARALALDPAHPKALWLLASADEESGRWSQAIDGWKRLLAVLPPDSADARIVSANLTQDQKLAGAPATIAESMAAAPASESSVSGEVALAQAVASHAVTGETLFIVAKSVDSPGPPLAVYRGAVGAWPVHFTLNDSMAMIPGRNLSGAHRVTIEARISQSGQATPASGDLAGSSAIVDPAARAPVRVVIERVIP